MAWIEKQLNLLLHKLQISMLLGTDTEKNFNFATLFIA